jgi:hypothetical protein
MSTSLLAIVEYGGYVAPYKLLMVLGLFLTWMPLVNWVYMDSQAVRTDKRVWTGTIAITGAAALWVWLLVPVFWIGFFIYVILVGSVAMAYVLHRNARVAELKRC